MASIGFSLGTTPPMLTANQMGAPDLAAAIRSGFDTYQKGATAAFTPKTLAEQLLSSQLANKINAVKARYAEREAQSSLAGQSLAHQLTRLKLAAAIEEAKRRKENPFWGMTGVGGNLGLLNELNLHPDRYASILGQQGAQEPEGSHIPNLGVGSTQEQQPGYAQALMQSMQQPQGMDYLQQMFGGQQQPQMSPAPQEQAQEQVAPSIMGRTPEEEAAQNPLEQAATAQQGLLGGVDVKDLLRQNILAGLKPKGATAKENALESANNTLAKIKAQYPPDSKEVKDAEAYVEKIAHGVGNTTEGKKREEQRFNLSMWRGLGKEGQEEQVALARGQGIPGWKTREAMENGIKFKDFLKQNGKDPNNLKPPVPTPTQANRTQNINQRKAIVEYDYLNQRYQDLLGKEASQVRGYSIDQIKNALTGKNKEDQARYLAAYMISADLVPIQLAALNAKGTVHAIESATKRSLLTIKPFTEYVNGDVLKRAMNIHNQTINNAFQKGMDAQNGIIDEVDSEISNNGSSAGSGNFVTDADGTKWRRAPTGQWEEVHG